MIEHKIGLSGSTILSDPDKYESLFKNQQIQHIEIGEFPDQEALDYFLKVLQNYDHTFSLHSPLLRHQSKYDLLERVNFDSEESWSNFEDEVALMSEIGAEYILVHFPYFKEKLERDANRAIEEGLKKLHALQEKYGLTIVCEPKLGFKRSAVGIEALHNFPVEIWAKYGIKLCVDIGDYLLATGSRIFEYIKKWKSFIKVVHLHNIEFHNNKYIWVPVHPKQEMDSSYYNVQELILQLAKSPDVFFIFEHTPHSHPSDIFVEEGIDWVIRLLDL